MASEETAATIDASDLITAVQSLSDYDDAIPVVTVSQSWEIFFVLSAEQTEADAAGSLLAACQSTSPDCAFAAATAEGRRRARRGLQSGSAAATRLTRSLVSGPLNSQIPNLADSGVVLTGTSFVGADAQLSVTQQGGAIEAEQLLSGSLSPEAVRASVSDELGLNPWDLGIVVTQPTFPPMPPPVSPRAAPPPIPVTPPLPLYPPPSIEPSHSPPQTDDLEEVEKEGGGEGRSQSDVDRLTVGLWVAGGMSLLLAAAGIALHRYRSVAKSTTTSTSTTTSMTTSTTTTTTTKTTNRLEGAIDAAKSKVIEQTSGRSSFRRVPEEDEPKTHVKAVINHEPMPAHRLSDSNDYDAIWC